MRQAATMPERASATMPDVLRFMRLLWAVSHALQRRSKRMSHDLGITGPQRLVLRVVGLLPGVSAGELAATLHVHPSTLTGVLQRLARQKLLDRIDDPRDRRRAVLRLTRAGVRANSIRIGTVESAIAEALKGVSAHDRSAARRALERIAEHLEPRDRAAVGRPRRPRRNRATR
jgi:DNA-binding MarR family transcriptional regulator